jgi:hypothetical protein
MQPVFSDERAREKGTARLHHVTRRLRGDALSPLFKLDFHYGQPAGRLAFTWKSHAASEVEGRFKCDLFQ